MQPHSIEAGQRLNMRTNEKSGIVLVQAEAMVPVGYWICQDEASGQRRVVAATALSPLEPPLVTPSLSGPLEPSMGPAQALTSDLGPTVAPAEALAGECGVPTDDRVAA